MTDLAAEWTSADLPLPTVGDPEAHDRHWHQWREAGRHNPEGAVRAFALGLEDDPGARALLSAVFGNSPYLSRGLIADPAFARLLIEQGPDRAWAAADAAVKDSPAAETTDAAMKRLRAAKRRAALAIGMADVASVWPLDRITGVLSDLAEAALRAACRHVLRALHDSGALVLPHPEAPESGSGLIVLGMGKLGARELNYSSDVDLIVLYDPDVAPSARGDLQPLFNRLVRRLIRIMDERTADGYVFRTDLRLRPDPASTPLALSVPAARRYYETAGRNWERAAMIKARPVAGDSAAGEAFLDALQPFVWRRHLDFAAVQDVQTIKRQIDASHGSGAGAAVAGYNVKLGPGGIREIEFFAQAQQLAWGGRSPELRVRGTLAALDALVAAGRVSRAAAADLRAAYEFLRSLEHRLQMVNDAQTHRLPESDDGVARIACFMGFESTAAFSGALATHRRTVARHYATLFADEPAPIGAVVPIFPQNDDDDATLRAIAEMGYSDPPRVSAMVRGWLAGRWPALRGSRARDLLAALAPSILGAFSVSADPDTALRRFDGFLAHLSEGVHLFSLLGAHPQLLGLIAEIMGSAPRLAERLTRRPALLDSVLSRGFSDLEVPDDSGLEPALAESARRGLVRLFYRREFGAAEMEADLAGAVAGARDFQDILDAQRRWANDRLFQIGVHILRGLLSPVEAGRPLSDLADACLRVSMRAVGDEFTARHGRVAGGAAAVVALGKLGSREMTVGSDLDFLFLYDHHPDAAESDGERPMAPDRYYTRLCRRLIAAVAAPTAEGRSYDIDMRLRPSGKAGPVACSLAAFIARHRSGTRVWERQALTRARVVHAEGGLGERFEDAKRAVLMRPVARDSLAAETAATRDRIRGRCGSGGPWSIEHMRGGLLDVEFIARFLQLAHAAETPEILAGDAVSVFEAAGARELIDPEAARELAQAATLWRNLQGILRLTVGADFAAEDATGAFKNVVGRSCGRVVFDALVDTMEDTARRVAEHYDNLLTAGDGFRTGTLPADLGR